MKVCDFRHSGIEVEFIKSATFDILAAKSETSQSVNNRMVVAYLN